MSVFSFFLSKYYAAWPEDVDSPDFSERVVDRQGLEITKYNGLYFVRQQMKVDDGETKTVTWPVSSLSTTAEWKLIHANVIGNCRLSNTGTDPFTSGAITTILPVYGVEKFPGKAFLSTYGLGGTLSVIGLADDTIVDLLIVLSCADTDSRLSTNA